MIRRYAPDSVKFDDAKPSSLTEIHPGDQLRARGNRTADGAELAAEEMVTGSFRNLAGIINSVDASQGTISVQDLLSKKPARVKITQDSQLRKLPPEMAQRIAARLKAAAATPGSDTNASRHRGQWQHCTVSGTAGRNRRSGPDEDARAIGRSPRLPADAEPHACNGAVGFTPGGRGDDRRYPRRTLGSRHGYHSSQWRRADPAGRSEW